ncbi:hypothetical protein ACP70R_042705 [Stipagrostis hirtigluma subsp. patula]
MDNPEATLERIALGVFGGFGNGNTRGGVAGFAGHANGITNGGEASPLIWLMNFLLSDLMKLTSSSLIAMWLSLLCQHDATLF